MGSTIDDLALLTALRGESETSQLREAPAKRQALERGNSRTASNGLSVDHNIEPLSGIRVAAASRRLSRSELTAMASSFAYHQLANVPRLMGGTAAVEGAWLTIGVLVDKGPAKPTQRGDSFCVWKLSDLKRGGAATTISVFLFSEAFAAAWKELPGSVFALLTPRPVPNKASGGPSNNDIALSVDHSHQLQRIGQVRVLLRDLGPVGMPSADHSLANTHLAGLRVCVV